jgi:Mg-chelatase subunit ChlD
MSISFIYPAALWLLLLIVPLLLLAVAAPRRMPAARFWSSLVLRAILFIALIGALAGTQLVRRVDRLTTVFLVDSSDSVSPDERARAESFIQAALETMREGDQAAIVAFGDNALVERAPSPEQALRRIQSAPDTSRTDIGDAINLGLALLPADTQKRLVLLSDGGENAGDSRAAIELARARGVPIEVVTLGEATNDLVQLSDLRAPASARKGQTIALQVVVESTAATGGTVRIREGAQTIIEEPVALEPGRQTFAFEVEAASDGFARYTAEIEVDGDTRRQNNQAVALVNVQGEPRVLIVEGRSGESANLAAALRAAQMNPTVVAPQGIPTNLADLGGYDAVVLANVPAAQLPTSAMELLPAYVRELGRGLVMLGGDRSYGMGGYNRTPVEAALPVNMEVRDKERRPDVAIVFVVDASGSMAACHCDDPSSGSSSTLSGVVKVDIAKEAVLQASALLQEDDKLGVVAFDDVPRWAVNVAQVPSLSEIQQAISPIAPNGQTNVRGGLLAAKQALEETEARVKHVILLTDGWSSAGNQTDIADELRAEGITLSTIAAGSGSAPYLEDLADRGGGRYYPVANMEDVPQIFVEETVKTVGSYLIEQQFTPTLVGDSPILRGLTSQGWPSLYGYNGTELKDSAQLVLRSPEGDPVLAQWQYGLGRAVAWTSDMKGQWGVDLVRWDGFAPLAAQLVGWTIPSDVENALNAEARIEGTQAVIAAQARDADGQPIPDASITATIIGSDGRTEQVPLRQVGPGQFQASVPSPAAGSFLVQLSARDGATPLGQQMVGLVVPYSPEYRQQQSNPDLLRAIAGETGGSVLQSPATVFTPNQTDVRRAREIAFPLLLLAALLLPIDIAVRRLGLRRRDFAAARTWVWERVRSRRGVPVPADPTLRDLQRAKARAGIRGARRRAPHESPPAATPDAPPAPDVTHAAPPTPARDSQPAGPRRPAPRVERPTPDETRAAAESSGEDALARLRAAKDRARRER